MLIKDAAAEPAAIVRDVHQLATTRLVRSMGGFCSALEDRLFELGAAQSDDRDKRHYFDVMRELRRRHSSVMNRFARRLDRSHGFWLAPRELHRAGRVPRGETLDAAVMQRAWQRTQELSAALGEIGERVSQLTGLAYGRGEDLPIAPLYVSRAFLRCWAHSGFGFVLEVRVAEHTAPLFSRCVLDGLGGIYDECNRMLRSLGYLTTSERALRRHA